MQSVWEGGGLEAGKYKEVHKLKGHVGYVLEGGLQPDGRYLASGAGLDREGLGPGGGDSTEPVTLRGHAGYSRPGVSPRQPALASASGYAGHE